LKILLCIDDDPVFQHVLHALHWSVDVSKWTDVLALHVVSSGPLLLTSGNASPRRGRALLDRACSELSSLSLEFDALLGSGDPAQEIVRTAEECQADLIVIGALGERRDFLMGSVSQKVVSLAGTDVLVVRSSECAEAAAGAPDRRLRSFRAVVAVDGSIGSEAGIESFATKLRARAAVIRLVHVVERVPSLWEAGKEEEPSHGALDSRAEEVLARAKKSLESRGLDVECEWRQGSPASQILESARQFESDLIVVGSRGHSAIREMVLGSVTHRVLRHAPCTVLCARGWAPESDAERLPWASESWEPEAGMA
jgi:nucleotide-binding universal stress UspA family protein